MKFHIYYEVGTQFHFFACEYPIFPALDVLANLSNKDQVLLKAGGSFQFLNVIHYMSILVMRIYHYLDYCRFLVSFNKWMLQLCLLFQDALVIWILFIFILILGSLHNSVKKSSGILKRMIESMDQFEGFRFLNDITSSHASTCHSILFT